MTIAKLAIWGTYIHIQVNYLRLLHEMSAFRDTTSVYEQNCYLHRQKGCYVHKKIDLLSCSVKFILLLALANIQD